VVDVDALLVFLLGILVDLHRPLVGKPQPARVANEIEGAGAGVAVTYISPRRNRRSLGRSVWRAMSVVGARAVTYNDGIIYYAARRYMEVYKQT
jgi:uncharacterized membrane protein YoaK (UPF0700 family)